MTYLNKIEIPLPFDDEEKFCLFAEQEKRNSLFVIDTNEADEYGEACHQLVEGCSYEYCFKTDRYELQADDVVSVSKRDKSGGRIVPNIFVGRLSLKVFDRKTSEFAGNIDLEVRSVKSNYRDDYRYMLEYITEKCTELLLQASSPVKQHLTPDYLNNPKTLYQRFAFIQSVIQTDEFGEAVQRVISSPVTQWKEEAETADIRKVKRISGKEIRQIASGRSRMDIPDGHFLREKGLTSLPTHIQLYRKTDTVDTPENRFIKHALEVFLKLCLDIELRTQKGTRINVEANQVIKSLENHLSHSLFKEISRPATLRLNSPVLQRREGYREILRAWLMFDLAALLVWKGGDDVYDAGKRDVATLYEYWLFFTLLDLFAELFHLKPKDVEDLIVESADGLSLMLKQGIETAIKGVYDAGSRKLNVKFCFNRSFGGGKKYPDGGSWTKTLRPDYTLSIWPDGIGEKQAEEQELIVHIHFDAKYKIDNLTQIINSEEEDENVVRGNIRGKYKNVDLLKMHAYKDAIRRTAGAYVLYPGDQISKEAGFREIIPGLGAFPVRPSKSNNGTAELKDFVKEVIAHFLNRASQREKMSFRTYDIHKSDSDQIVKEPLPELIGENRNLLPDETFVLVGFYEVDKWQWITSERLYNARADSNRGSLKLGPKEAGAKYLLLHTRGETSTGRILKIVDTGPRVFSKQTLKKHKYPTEPSQDYYLVYKIENIVEKELLGCKWDITKLNDYKTGRGSGLPFAVSLSELMKAKV